MLKILFVACCLGLVAAELQLSCKKACGSAIQVGSKIQCYCHAMCVLNKPGECCGDFEEMCPAEAAEGKIKAQLKDEPTEAPVVPDLPEGCDVPGSNIIPVPEHTYKWSEKNTCNENCGSAMTHDDGSLFCFCDSGCLLTADCCIDFIDVCEIDPCILALAMPGAGPNAWEPGSCKQSCGAIVAGKAQGTVCSCETACVEVGTCCEDFQEVCPDMYDESLLPPPKEIKDGSCEGKCGLGSGSCFCDYQCVESGDCCEDYEDKCGAKLSYIQKKGKGSCHNKCGGAGFDCWCDEKCLIAGDCCYDYLSKCVTAEDGTCDGNCGEYGGGCWCDDKCTTHGDCCADKNQFC